MSALATRVAGAPLGEQERRALELRERSGAGYAEIASAVGVEPREVAALLSSARLGVREAVRGTAAPAPVSEECARARPLLSARQDGEPLDAEERAFLRAHVDRCQSCRTARVALREGSLALRAVLDAAPAIAAPVVVPAPRPQPQPQPQPQRERAPRRRRRAPAVLAVAVLASFVASIATILIGGDEPRPSSAAQPAATPETTATPEAMPDRDRAAERAAARRRKAAAAKARRERAERRRRREARAAAAATPVATATPEPAAATTTPEPAQTPSKPRREKPAKPQNTGGSQDTDTSAGPGGAVIPQQPTDNPDGKPDVIPDSCSEENPDCDSG